MWTRNDAESILFTCLDFLSDHSSAARTCPYGLFWENVFESLSLVVK